MHTSALEYLCIRVNGLHRIPSEIFTATARLSVLDLTANALSQVPAHLFTRMTGLHRLYFNENRLQHLDPPSFETLSCLEILELSQNRLSDVSGLVLPANLITLRLADNLLTQFPSLSHLSRLHCLQICRNPWPSHLTISGGDFAHMPDLTIFDIGPPLDKCQISSPRLINSSKLLQTLAGGYVRIQGWELLQQDLRHIISPATSFKSVYLGYFRLPCTMNLSNVKVDLRVACSTCTSMTVTIAMELNNLEFLGHPVLTSLHIETLGDMQLRTFNVSKNPMLQRLHPLVPATTFDISETNLPFMPRMCKTTGTTLIRAASLQNQATPTPLIQHCANRALLLNFADNANLSLATVQRAVANLQFINDPNAGNCSFRSIFGLACAYSDIPVLMLTGSPIQCELQATSHYIWNPLTRPLPLQVGQQSYECSCSAGYVPSGSECVKPPPPWYKQPRVIVILSLLGSLVIIIPLGYRYHKHRQRQHQALELKQSLLENDYNHEIQELKRAWEIDSHEVKLIDRVDRDSPGSYGEVWKAKWGDMTICVKNLRVEMGEHAIFDFEKELDFLQRTRHPQLVRFFGAGTGYLDSASGGTERPFMVMELVANGSLKSVLRGCAAVTLEQWKTIMTLVWNEDPAARPRLSEIVFPALAEASST
eukprot:TRINITY_DN6408_c0_g1_i1.p1 TRINITY_DN6408_c0_g1~~TRINITY_DN6408_c0_g1_i1.p1  ORF type:complete len:652 (+),score=75.19 TRINITY_DN6408_c0_g1_i1:763-2718(+)